MSLITDQIPEDLSGVSTRTAVRRAAPPYKRIFDIALAVTAAVFLLPFFVLISIGLLVADGRPILYRHRRIGAGGKPFDCLKFRTMRRDSKEILEHLLATDPERAAEWKQSQKLKGDPRVHLLGRYMRITSADELPQIFNVLLGDMSIVGPRPVTDAELDRYGPHVGYYLAMRPGLTGLWQVMRRPQTTYDERVRLDVQYYHTRKLTTDLIIIFRTIGVVLFATNEHR